MMEYSLKMDTIIATTNCAIKQIYMSIIFYTATNVSSALSVRVHVFTGMHSIFPS